MHYNVMMMSVLQEVKGLKKKLYFIILPVGRPVSMQEFRLNVYTFDISTACIIMFVRTDKYSLHYDVLSGKVYAYALAWVKTCVNAKFQVQNCYGY